MVCTTLRRRGVDSNFQFHARYATVSSCA
jgi:hypothetical protein